LGVFYYNGSMHGAIAHHQAERLRDQLIELAGMHDAGKTSPAFRAFFRVVDVLESSPDAVILPADELLSTQEVAELLGVSRMTVVRLVEKGELVAEGGGTHRRIAASELARYRTATAARRRSALEALARDIGVDTPPDQIVRTR
jgi:excisionase family DNA binding protein